MEYRTENHHQGVRKRRLKPVSASGRGFSLFELMIVLLLIGMLAGMAMPSTARFLDNLHFREKTAAVTDTLRYARLLSVTKGSDVVVSVDGENGRALKISGPVEETREFDFGADDSLVMEPAEIAFWPEGHATPAILIFSSGKRRRQITIDALTGMPSVE